MNGGRWKDWWRCSSVVQPCGENWEWRIPKSLCRIVFSRSISGSECLWKRGLDVRQARSEWWGNERGIVRGMKLWPWQDATGIWSPWVEVCLWLGLQLKGEKRENFYFSLLLYYFSSFLGMMHAYPMVTRSCESIINKYIYYILYKNLFQPMMSRHTSTPRKESEKEMGQGT